MSNKLTTNDFKFHTFSKMMKVKTYSIIVNDTQISAILYINRQKKGDTKWI